VLATADDWMKQRRGGSTEDDAVRFFFDAGVVTGLTGYSAQASTGVLRNYLGLLRIIGILTPAKAEVATMLTLVIALVFSFWF
jgi:hypothetical protein